METPPFYVLGQPVLYILTNEDKKMLEDSGNSNASDVLPGIIVAVWGDTPESVVNIKVFCDGEHPDLWKTSVSNGNEPGNFKV